MHPDDEALSGHLDGEDDSDTAAHLAACPTCRARLAELEAVAAAVAQPVPARDDAEREAAVSAALSTVLDGDDEMPVSPASLSRRPRRLPPWALAAAALVLAVLAAVPLLGRVGTGQSHKASSATSARSLNKEGPAASSGAQNSFAAGGVPDLGPQSDEQALRTLVSTVLTDQQNGREASGSGSGAAATGGVAASAAAATSGDSGVSAVPPAPALDCPSTAAAAAGTSSSTLQYHATLRWQGQPADLFVFQLPNGPRTAVVSALTNCQILVTFTV